MYIYIYINLTEVRDKCNIYVIMKTMCSPSYHCNGFVETHAPWHKMYIYVHVYI